MLSKQQQTLMEVEAHHMNILPSQLISSRKNFIKPNQGMNNMYNNTILRDPGLLLPIREETQTTVLPCYQSFVSDPVSGRTSLNTDSGLTCNFPATKKRSRDSMNELNPLGSSQKDRIAPLSSILDQDITNQMQLQQSEIDLLIAQHTKKLRIEMAEQRKQHTKMLISTLRELIVSKLNEKDETILRMEKLNLDLQERVKNLMRDNQLWRNMAQTSEAKVNSLRTNLEQVLTQVNTHHAVEDDAESCCGSNDYGRENAVAGGGGMDRMCKMCGVKESSVLLLPCRHLCLCTMCGSTLHTCRVCKSFTSGSVHVNMS